jgi:hypothetical protein
MTASLTSRLAANWLYANPSGNIQGASDKAPVDLNRDLAFNIYSTVVGKVDWKFTHSDAKRSDNAATQQISALLRLWSVMGQDAIAQDEDGGRILEIVRGHPDCRK